MKNLLIQLAAESYRKDGTVTPVGNSTQQGSDLGETVTGILNAVIGVLSFVCVVVIIIGGVTYMTSSGDTTKVKKAKDTILYGVIGLVVCVLAFAIVNFVISNILSNS